MNFYAVKTGAAYALSGVAKFVYRVINFLVSHWPRNITVLFRRRAGCRKRRLPIQAISISRSARVI